MLEGIFVIGLNTYDKVTAEFVRKNVCESIATPILPADSHTFSWATFEGLFSFLRCAFGDNLETVFESAFIDSFFSPPLSFLESSCSDFLPSVVLSSVSATSVQNCL